MKKVINQKRYDTDTAECVSKWNNDEPRNSFSFVRETLYRKKTGEYFLHGEGGANTIYARHIDDNTWSGGERLIPLTLEKAREWAEEKLDADEYEKIFGTVDEDAEDRQLAVWVSPKAFNLLEKEIERTGKTKREIVDMLLLTLE